MQYLVTRDCKCGEKLRRGVLGQGFLLLINKRRTTVLLLHYTSFTSSCFLYYSDTHHIRWKYNYVYKCLPNKAVHMLGSKLYCMLFEHGSLFLIFSSSSYSYSYFPSHFFFDSLYRQSKLFLLKRPYYCVSSMFLLSRLVRLFYSVKCALAS
jgi:hypothetical protein